MSLKFEPKVPLTKEKLQAIVFGRDASFPRSAAMTLLRTSDSGDQVQIFQRLLESEEEPPRFRYLAAQNLYRMNTPESREALMAASRTVKDSETRTSIVKGLGRIGSKEALAEVLRIQKDADGVLLKQCRFAAALISHRFDLQGNDLLMPTEMYILAREKEAMVEHGLPSAKEADLCLKTLQEEPFDLELSARSLRQINCGNMRWMLAMDKKYVRAGAFDELLKCKTLLGIMAGRSFVTDSYSVGYLMMTRPSGEPGTIDILMPRVTGEPGFIGKAKARRGKEAVFTIRSGVQPGIFAMEASGRFSGKGELELDKVSSAATIRKKRRPKKLKAV